MPTNLDIEGVGRSRYLTSQPLAGYLDHACEQCTDRSRRAAPVTIAISVKVNDGIVLAADSASTLIDKQTGVVRNVYNNANKIFNLRKGLPIGAMTWGSGSIGSAAISTLAKDLRQRFSGEDAAHLDWRLQPDNYTIEAVAERLRAFMFDELYTPAFAHEPQKPFLGFCVAGFSSGAAMADAFDVRIENGQCGPPTRRLPLDECGVNWDGQPEAVHRLIVGASAAVWERYSSKTLASRPHKSRRRSMSCARR